MDKLLNVKHGSQHKWCGILSVYDKILKLRPLFKQVILTSANTVKKSFQPPKQIPGEREELSLNEKGFTTPHRESGL